MITIVGIVVVFGAVLGGFLLEGGPPIVLVQPAEYVIIGGAALGAALVGNSPKVVVTALKQLAAITKGGHTKDDYMQMLVMLYELMTIARKDGLVALEAHVEKPHESPVLTKYPSFLHNHHAVGFMADTIRLIISGAEIEPHELDALLEGDIETHHHEAEKPARMLQTMADAFPGLGIVAAVLGVVITMGHIDQPPEVIGHHVGAALVGTFIGILLSYGFVGPLSAKMGDKTKEESKYLVAMKQVLLAFHRGTIPTVAVEFARRSMSSEIRPEFNELETACREASGKRS